ncbi:OmpA family protein [Desertivirga xinjiangensis]|uniref:OmpA family protein n=1 Tax=Desertivirga xinjiangensis TaxID=539206 RepID=UPI00210B41CC|nr:OmpA family protein [Pedobacter xinjiangensis]
MNYSTLKKVFAVSALALAGVSTASAQDATATTSAPTTTVFGGSSQYRTWSIGVNGGVLAPIIPFGSNDYNEWEMDFGYGAFIKKQFTHGFAAKLDFHRGKLNGDADVSNPPGAASTGFQTELHYAIALKGVASFGNVSFLSRTKNVNFYGEAGAGIASYDVKSQRIPVAGNDGEDALFIPVGVGANFKLSNVITLNLGYTANFLDNDDLDGAFDNGSSNKDRWSYGYAGLEFALGNKAKPSLLYTNPIAVMYDELKDPTLRQEVEALKTRVSTLENTVNQLSADADGDGVSDKFDKEPNSAAGAVVDGSGRTIKFPNADSLASAANPYGNIQFEFDSSVLKTSSYPALDKVASDLRANSAAKIGLDGHASAEGTESYNVNLSRDRANSVKTYLVNSGVDANRISVKAYGESRPIASNATEEGRVQNRRVEIKR